VIDVVLEALLEKECIIQVEKRRSARFAAD